MHVNPGTPGTPVTPVTPAAGGAARGAAGAAGGGGGGGGGGAGALDPDVANDKKSLPLLPKGKTAKAGIILWDLTLQLRLPGMWNELAYKHGRDHPLVLLKPDEVRDFLRHWTKEAMGGEKKAGVMQFLAEADLEDEVAEDDGDSGNEEYEEEEEEEDDEATIAVAEAEDRGQDDEYFQALVEEEVTLLHCETWQDIDEVRSNSLLPLAAS